MGEEWDREEDSGARLTIAPMSGNRVVSPYIAKSYLFGKDRPAWAGEERDEEGNKIFDAVVRHWKTIGISALLSFSAAAIYSVCATRLYTSEATLRIGSYAPLISGAEIENVLRQQSMEQSYQKTQMASLTGLSIADRVLSNPEIGPKIKEYSRGISSRIPFFRSKPDAAEIIPEGYHHTVAQLKKYLKLIKINPVRETVLVEVQVETSDPELSRAVANIHSEAFVEELRVLRHTAMTENSRFLAEQANDLGQKVINAERRVAEYAKENKLFALANEQDLLTRRIKTLTENQARVMGERIRLGALMDQVNGGSGLDSTIIDDESIRTLRTTLESAEADYAHLRTRFTAEYPPTAQALARVTSLRRTITQQRGQAISALRAKYASVVQAETSLGEQIEKQKSLDHETSRRLVEYNTLQREYDSVRDLHQSVLRQLKEMQIAAAGTSSNVMITERAVAATEPSSPRVGALLILGAIFGVGIGGAIAILRQLLDRTLHTIDEIPSHFGVVSFGSVPQFEWSGKQGREIHSLVAACMGRIRQVSGYFSIQEVGRGDVKSSIDQDQKDVVQRESVELITIDQPSGMISEAFRTIRTSLLLASADSPPRTVLVTSPRKGEGKTTVASNLAIVLAQAGQRTVLIDTDIRSPSIDKRFSLNQRNRGLVEYLTGHLSLEEVIQETVVPRLWIIPAGTAAPNPAELVGSRKMADLLSLLSRRYDQVILDSPPLLPFSDSLMMSHVVDGVLLVARSEVSEKRAVGEAIERLRSIRAPLLGVVMNGVPTERAKWSAYCSYYQDSAVVSDAMHM
jgi:succinoglycan biosynthesis transport protein ExoP